MVAEKALKKMKKLLKSGGQRPIYNQARGSSSLSELASRSPTSLLPEKTCEGVRKAQEAVSQSLFSELGNSQA